VLLAPPLPPPDADFFQMAKAAGSEKQNGKDSSVVIAY
jgi:hypothetical protein